MTRSAPGFGFFLAVICLLSIPRLCWADIGLIEADEVWFYHKGTNAPQANWRTIADSSLNSTWATGPGGFGYADNTTETRLCQTILSDMRSNYSTLYIRKQFTVASGVDTNMHLMLSMDFDDGFIAWLDGNYLTNANVTGAPNEPAYTATANALHESSNGDSTRQPAVTYDLGAIGTRLNGGDHILSIIGLNQAKDTSGDFIQVVDLYLAPAPVPPVVAHGDVWRYHPGTNAPQSNWKTSSDANLAPSAWASGAGGFGYADNAQETSLCQTLLPNMRSNYSTLYMRKEFTATSALDTNQHLYLTMDWDDGFIAWLDGNYLTNANVAGAPAEPGYAALASASHESSRGDSSAQPAVTFDLGRVGTRLSPGAHVFAIMGLNNDKNASTDFIQIADLSVLPGPVEAPPNTNFPPGWRFVVVGDSRGNTSDNPVNTQILDELAHAATNENPAFILFPGDLVLDGNQGLSAYSIWTNTMGPVYAAGIPVYPIMGNHDISGIGPTTFTNLFGPTLPANGPSGEIFRTYSFVYSNALILALDNYIGGEGWINQPWVNARLATNRLPHIFVMGHMPAFQVSSDHTSIAEARSVSVRDAFWNSLCNAGAKLYFCGHYHFFDHARIDDGDGSLLDDMHQYVLGTGGAPWHTAPATYPGLNSTWTPRGVAHEANYGYGLVNVDGPTVTVTWKRRVGAGNYQAADVFTYTSPRVPVLSIADNGNDSIELNIANVMPGTNHVVEQRSSVTADNWQFTDQFVSPSNTYQLTQPRTNDTLFYRVRVP